VWLELARVGQTPKSLTYQEALESALCFGWIDGQKRSLDAGAWLQRFTPRRSRSKWSQINCAKATALLAAKRVRPAGLREIDAAKADGRWQAAYAPQRTIRVPPELEAILAAEPRLRARFDALDSRNRYAILYRLQDAKKPETRAHRLQNYMDLLRAGKTIY